MQRLASVTDHRANVSVAHRPPPTRIEEREQSQRRRCDHETINNYSTSGATVHVADCSRSSLPEFCHASAELLGNLQRVLKVGRCPQGYRCRAAIHPCKAETHGLGECGLRVVVPLAV